jgi:hypothetical protein
VGAVEQCVQADERKPRGGTSATTRRRRSQLNAMFDRRHSAIEGRGGFRRLITALRSVAKALPQRTTALAASLGVAMNSLLRRVSAGAPVKRRATAVDSCS